MCKHLYIYFIALSRQTNIILNSQVIKEILNLENLTDLIGLYLFNPLLNKQNFLIHVISNNDDHNYLEKNVPEKSNNKPKIPKGTFAVSSAPLDNLSQVSKFYKPISRLVSTAFTQFSKTRIFWG